jgi:hypothetical protein
MEELVERRIVTPTAVGNDTGDVGGEVIRR